MEALLRALLVTTERLKGTGRRLAAEVKSKYFNAVPVAQGLSDISHTKTRIQGRT